MDVPKGKINNIEDAERELIGQEQRVCDILQNTVDIGLFREESANDKSLTQARRLLLRISELKTKSKRIKTSQVEIEILKNDVTCLEIESRNY